MYLVSSIRYQDGIILHPDTKYLIPDTNYQNTVIKLRKYRLIFIKKIKNLTLFSISLAILFLHQKYLNLIILNFILNFDPNSNLYFV